MYDRSFTIEQVLALLTLLAETPPRLAALTAGLAPAHLQARPGPAEWSHLKHMERFVSAVHR